MMMTITKPEAEKLAAYVATIRTDWGVAGIVAAIGNAREMGSSTEIATALLNLAKNDTMRTPSFLAQDGPHWARTRRSSAAATKCGEHPGIALRAGSCPECDKDLLPPDAARGARLAATVRADLKRRQHAHKAGDHGYCHQPYCRNATHAFAADRHDPARCGWCTDHEAVTPTPDHDIPAQDDEPALLADLIPGAITQEANQ